MNPAPILTNAGYKAGNASAFFQATDLSDMGQNPSFSVSQAINYLFNTTGNQGVFEIS